MRRSKAFPVVAVPALLVALLGGCSLGSDKKPTPGITVVDWSVTEHELLDDVLAIAAKRREGASNFSYVPQSRPDGLTRMSAHAADEGTKVLDAYQLTGGPVQVIIEFTAEPTKSCEEMNSDPGGLFCIRDEKLAVAADDPKMRNLMVYSGQEPAASSDIRKFWSTVKLVPVADAAWFTELLKRAEAAPKAQLG